MGGFEPLYIYIYMYIHHINIDININININIHIHIHIHTIVHQYYSLTNKNTAIKFTSTEYRKVHLDSQGGHLDDTRGFRV